MARAGIRIGKEMFVAVVLLGFGLFALPPMVYWVGTRVVGEYGAQGGLDTLTRQIWTDLANGNVFAWMLVTGPYLIIQLLRLGRVLWRSKPDVNSVTVSDANQ